MSKTVVHTCYGCEFYYKTDKNGEKIYLAPHSYRNCDFENTWDCSRFCGITSIPARVSEILNREERENER